MKIGGCVNLQRHEGGRIEVAWDVGDLKRHGSLRFAAVVHVRSFAAADDTYRGILVVQVGAHN